MTESFNWLGRCARAAAFGIAALLLLTIARIVFFFAYKNDDLGDPLINSYHALALKLATKEEILNVFKTI